MTSQIKVRGNKKFDDVNRNNFNRDNVNRRITANKKCFKAISLPLTKLPKRINDVHGNKRIS